MIPTRTNTVVTDEYIRVGNVTADRIGTRVWSIRDDGKLLTGKELVAETTACAIKKLEKALQFDHFVEFSTLEAVCLLTSCRWLRLLIAVVDNNRGLFKIGLIRAIQIKDI